MKLTKDLIVKKTRKSYSRLKDVQGYVKKLTHAQLQNQQIDEIVSKSYLIRFDA